MKATRFIRKPFVVTGYKVTEQNMDAIARWCQGNVIRDTDRPFVRVPVQRYTNTKQTEGHVGMWVLLSEERGQDSFKVYTDEWLEKNFIQLPREIDEEEDKTVDLSRYMKSAPAESDEDADDYDRPPPANNVRHLPTQKAKPDPLPPFQTIP